MALKNRLFDRWSIAEESPLWRQLADKQTILTLVEGKDVDGSNDGLLGVLQRQSR